MELGSQTGALVTWSSGRDSTLTLLKLLKETTKDVRTISFSNYQIENSGIELEYRKELREKLLQIRHFDSIEVELKDDGHGMTRNGGLIQPLIWTSLSTLYLRPNEDLYLSYVREDDFWYHKADIDSFFSSSKKMIGKEESQIVYPLELYDKKDVFLELHQYSLLSKTHYCQTKESHPCHICASCEKNNMTIDYLIKEGKIKLTPLVEKSN